MEKEVVEGEQSDAHEATENYITKRLDEHKQDIAEYLIR